MVPQGRTPRVLTGRRAGDVRIEQEPGFQGTRGPSLMLAWFPGYVVSWPITRGLLGPLVLPFSLSARSWPTEYCRSVVLCRVSRGRQRRAELRCAARPASTSTEPPTRD